MQSRKLRNLQDCQKELSVLLSDEVADFIIFGSLAKGGNANDVDIAVISKSPNTAGLKSRIKEKIENADITLLAAESIYSTLWPTLIKEGFSVRKNLFLHDLYNIKPVVLFKYSLKGLNPVQKVQFSRGIKNLLKNKGEVLTRAAVLIPIEMKNEFIDLLNTWKIYYESREFELFPIVRKEEFI
jgi:predicted nucleotidyltransferase